jgi:ABC-type multidrug transport system ATPase subunit
LLGHNGAGKTTTISMITGLLEATGGSASVFGMNILNSGMTDLRKIMGVCP